MRLLVHRVKKENLASTIPLLLQSAFKQKFSQNNEQDGEVADLVNGDGQLEMSQEEIDDEDMIEDEVKTGGTANQNMALDISNDDSFF